MSTVIWSEGRLVADTAVSDIDFATGVGKIVDGLVLLKILTPSNLMIFGEKIKAVGCVGDLRLQAFLEGVDAGEPVQGFDLCGGSFFQDLAVDIPSGCVVVTESFTYLITVANGEVQWQQFRHEVPIIVGSGHRHRTWYTGKVRPETAVMSIMGRDANTGGKIITWNLFDNQYREVEVLKDSKLTLRAVIEILTHPLRSIVFGARIGKHRVDVRRAAVAVTL